MKIIAIAKRTFGNITEGDVRRIDYVQRIEDKGGSVLVHIHDNNQTILDKKSWFISIIG